jgi:hypothetical protein
MKTRYDELTEKVIEYHKAHPEVWTMFVKYTFELINRRFKQYSAKGIFERVRWEADLKYGEGNFKVNNNYSAFYARAFMQKYPKYAGFFRLREQISKKEGAVYRPELTPDNFPYI